jgi:hypothetical protein
MRLLVAVLLALGSAHAQPLDELRDLAKQRANPLSGIKQITLSEQPNVGLPADARVQSLAQLTVTWPIPLGSDWSVVTYTIASGISQTDAAGDDRVGGLGDTMITAVLTPNETGALIWGVGPVVQIPTATDPALGSNRWAAGPAVALFVQPGPWTAGVLVENVWSSHEAGAQNVDAFSVLYNLTYNFPRGWFLESNTTLTADWTAPPGDRWTVPIGGGFGKVFTAGRWSLSASAEIFYNALRPPGGAEWSPSIAFQVLFP